MSDIGPLGDEHLSVSIKDARLRSVTIEIDGTSRTFVDVDDAPDRTPLSAKQLVTLMTLCTSLELAREDRLEIAEMLLARPVTTFRHLSAYEAQRLIDALNGFHLVWTVRQQRGLTAPPQDGPEPS